MPGLLLWLLAELVVFQPNEYDNNKLLYPAFAFLCCVWPPSVPGGCSSGRGAAAWAGCRDAGGDLPLCSADHGPGGRGQL